MPSCTRRSLLSSITGISLIGGVSTALARPPPTFETVWKNHIMTSADFKDSARLSDGTVVLALEHLPSSDRSDRPDCIALDDRGTRRWTWRWPDDRSDPLDYVKAIAPSSDGGLFIAGPTGDGKDGLNLVGKLDAEQNVEWHITHGESPRYTFLMPSTSSRLVVVGFTLSSTHDSRTHVFGVDTDNQLVTWEQETENNVVAASAMPYQQGCIIAGDTPSGGWATRFTAMGDVAWERIFPEPELSLSDVTASSAGEIVTIGHRINEPETVEVLALAGDGTLNVRRAPELDPIAVPDRPKIVSDPSGGYLCSWSYYDHPDLFVGKITSEGRVEYATHLDPWESEFTPNLEDLLVAEDTFLFSGDGEHPDTNDNFVWSLGITRSAPTPTPTTSPTQLADSPTPTPTSPPTTTPTKTARSGPTETGRSPTGTTSADGPGFGVLASILGLGGAGYLVSSRSNPTSEE